MISALTLGLSTALVVHTSWLAVLAEQSQPLPLTLLATGWRMVTPACMLFSLPIDSLAASGAILGDVWTDSKMPVVDSLGDEFLQYVQTGMTVTVGEDGLVTVEE